PQPEPPTGPTRAPSACLPFRRDSAILIQSPIDPRWGTFVLVRSVFTRASAAIDRSVVRFMERRMSPGTPKIDPGDARLRLIELAKDYSERTLGLPSPFFPTPEPPRVALTPLGDGPLGTQVVDLAFPSEYMPFHPEARDPYLSVTENMTAHARWWTSE